MTNENSLAILGGSPTFDKPLERYNSFGEEELNAANEVLRSGKLSYFLASWNEIPNIGSFYGGPKVQLFERLIEKHFNVKHAITVNSWTSGLIAAVGAIGIEPGDEVIVTPWTMCASATAILHWNAIPVFVDIEDETFNINPDKIEEKISEFTKAIMVVDIFGHSEYGRGDVLVAEFSRGTVVLRFSFKKKIQEYLKSFYNGQFRGGMHKVREK